MICHDEASRRTAAQHEVGRSNNTIRVDDRGQSVGDHALHHILLVSVSGTRSVAKLRMTGFTGASPVRTERPIANAIGCLPVAKLVLVAVGLKTTRKGEVNNAS